MAGMRTGQRADMRTGQWAGMRTGQMADMRTGQRGGMTVQRIGMRSDLALKWLLLPKHHVCLCAL